MLGAQSAFGSTRSLGGRTPAASRQFRDRLAPSPISGRSIQGPQELTRTSVRSPSDRARRVRTVPWTLIDLFAGCGGMPRGFEDPRQFESVFAVERDRHAAETYAVNIGNHIACAPIEDITEFPRADVIIGGPP